MTSRFPDLEIYLKRVPTDEVIKWLSTVFDDVSVLPSSSSARVPTQAATETSMETSAETSLETSTETSTQAPTQSSPLSSTVCLIHQTMACTISENVAKGGFTSVWFKTNETPWENDHECAISAFDHFQIETRCSTGGWEGEDDGGWLRITDKGSQTVNWHTS